MKLSRELQQRCLELAGETSAAKPARDRPPPRVRLVVWYPGLVVRSEANVGGRLRDKIARKQAVKAAILAGLPPLFPLPRPVRVVLTRVGGKRLDDDNLRAALKVTRDVVCGWLGVDDGDRAAVRFAYRQRPGFVAGVRVAVG